jgi:hypothetical protein
MKAQEKENRMGRNPLDWIDRGDTSGVDSPAAKSNTGDTPAGKIAEEAPGAMEKKPRTETEGKELKAHEPVAPAESPAAGEGKGTKAKSIFSGLAPGLQRQTYVLSNELVEKVRAYAYWERLEIKQVINAALTEYFADKKVKPHPGGEGRR